MDDTSGTPPRRASSACQFCRRRKIKCNNEQPRCANCKTYGKQCTYVQTAARPARRSARRPQQENSSPPTSEQGVASATESHSPLSQTQSRGNGHTHKLPSQSAHDAYASNHQNGAHRAWSATTAALSVPHADPSGQQGASSTTQYYGPTSAHFEGHSLPDGQQGRVASRKPPSELSDKLLMAEAAHQRQMETINYRSGKLDFDGVDPELGLHLLSLHWARQHHSFLVTYRPAFMRDMSCNGRYFSKLLLNAIYFGASKFSPRLELRRDPDDVRTAGWTFRRRVKELLGNALDRSDITTIQALLVMTNSLFALGDERSAAWLYAGLAFRMIVDLGIHVDRPYISGVSTASDEDMEIHRRVFWGAFVIDKIQSLYQGRPPSLQDFDTRVPIMFSDNYEELEYWTPYAFADSTNYPGSPAYSVSTFKELCMLSVIMNRIINRVYAEKSTGKDYQTLSSERDELQRELEDWSNRLPSHLAYNPTEDQLAPPPHVISLQAMYNVLLILLNRPFVSEGHLYQHSQATVVGAFGICTTAATRVVHLLEAYDRAFSIKRAPYLISYATYVSATIHVRIAAQRSPGSYAHGYLSTCLSVLEKNQETNWAVKKARRVIIDLAGRMNVNVPELISGQQPASNARNSPNEESALNSAAQSFSPVNAGRSQSDMNTTQSNAVSTPDLDMDAIIQSFMQAQTNSTHHNNHDMQANSQRNNMPPGLIPSQAALAHSVNRSTPTNSDMESPAQPSHNYFHYQGPEFQLGGWHGNSFTNELFFSDTLFGFHGGNGANFPEGSGW